MPGPYRGQAVKVHSARSIDETSNKADAQVVRAMLSQGMRALTGDKNERDSWARFISPKDVVGIKVNCSGAPRMCSSPEIVAGIVENLAGLEDGETGKSYPTFPGY